MKQEIKESSQNQAATAGQNDQAQLRAENEAPKSTETESGALAAAPCSASVDRRFKTAIVSESGRVIWWVNYDDPNAISHKRWIDLIGLAVNQALELGLRNEALYLLSNARPCSSDIESILRETTSPRGVSQTGCLEYTFRPSDSKNSISFEDSESNISNASREWISKSALSNIVGIGEFIIWEGDNAAPAPMQEQQQKPNAQTETHATETENPTEVAPQTGGVSSPVLCSASYGASDKQVSENNQVAINRLKQIVDAAQSLGDSARLAASSVRHLGSLLSDLSENVVK